MSCDDPEVLPARALTQREVELYWSRDRASLIVCKERHGGLLRFFTTRDANIARVK